MTRRALTLLELLVVIALLVAVGALVAPATVEGLRERAFASSVDVLRHQLLLARAHAQDTGRPVEVRYEAPPPRVGVLRYPALQPEAPPPGFAGGGVADADDDGEGRPTAIPAGWAERALADGVTLRDRPPQPKAPVPPAFRRGGAEPASGPQPRLRLALFLPDGSALVGGPVWLADRHGRLAEIAINAWTGLPEVTRVVGEPRGDEDALEDGEAPPDDGAFEADDAPPDRESDDAGDDAPDGEQAQDEEPQEEEPT